MLDIFCCRHSLFVRLKWSCHFVFKPLFVCEAETSLNPPPTCSIRRGADKRGQHPDSSWGVRVSAKTFIHLSSKSYRQVHQRRVRQLKTVQIFVRLKQFGEEQRAVTNNDTRKGSSDELDTERVNIFTVHSLKMDKKEDLYNWTRSIFWPRQQIYDSISYHDGQNGLGYCYCIFNWHQIKKKTK